MLLLRNFEIGTTFGTLASSVACVLMASLSYAFPAEVQIIAKVSQGKAPRLIVSVVDAAQNAEVTLARDDGRKFSYFLGNVSAGYVKEISLDASPGRHSYEGHMIATVEGEKLSSPLSFVTVVAPPLQITVARELLDLGERTLTFSTSRQIARASLKIIGLGDRVLAEETLTPHGTPHGAPLKMSWPPVDERDVVRLELRVEDEDGFHSAVALTPWSVAIPHEEVLFASGSAEIAAEEEPKLEDSLTQIRTALDRFREIQGVQLFIAGHTDTVGQPAYNKQLSQKRAAAIAAWFVKRRIPVRVSFAGLGEGSLKVKTADEVDEPRNRRVDYILSVETPSLRGATWQRLN